MNEVLWDSPFRVVQEKLEDWSLEFDMWFEDLCYLFIDPGFDLVGILDKELSNLAWYIYYTEFDITCGIENKTHSAIIESNITKYNYLVDAYNKIAPWWVPKKEYYNDGV